MGLLDDLFAPKPIGDVRLGRRGRHPSTVGSTVGRLLAAFVLFAAAWGVVFALSGGPSGGGVLALLLVSALYIIIGLNVHPTPDTSNLGWAGGLVNDPFRISDNINRNLLFFAVVLAPGRFAGEAIADMARLLIHGNER